MAALKRRTTLGLYASAAIPYLWDAAARHGWSHAEIARRLDVDKAMVAKIMYGDRKAGRDLAVACSDALGVPIGAWSEPIPKGWRVPHSRVRSAA